MRSVRLRLAKEVWIGSVRLEKDLELTLPLPEAKQLIAGGWAVMAETEKAIVKPQEIRKRSRNPGWF